MNEDFDKEKEEAGVNTAHVGLKTGAEVIAPGIGGKVYNAASKTPLVKSALSGAEKLGGKVIANTPVVGNINKKLNDSGAVNALDQKSSKSNGTTSNNNQRPKGGFKRPTGNRPRPNLSSNESNNPLTKQESNNDANQSSTTSVTTSSNVPKALQKRQEGGFLNRFGLGRSGNKSTETEESETESESTSPTETIEKTRKTLLTFIKLAPVLGPIAIIAMFFIFIIIAVAYPGSALASSISLNSYNTEEKELVYNETEDKENYDAEIAYNDAIRGSSGIVAEYQEKYGVTIDWLLLHNVLKYRYTIKDEDDLYSSDGNTDISEDEINDKLDELEKDEGEENEGEGNETSSSSDASIDFGEAAKKIEAVATLMITKNSDGTYTTDNTVGGSFYTALIDSSFLTTYYKDFLVDTEYETRKALVDEIFEQYEFEKEALNDGNNGAFLSDGMQLYLQTCVYPYSTTQNERGKTVFSNNRNINAGTNYPEYFSLTDYLKGAVEGELGRGSLTEGNREGVKAFVVATLTYMLGSFYVDFYPGVQTINFPTGDCRLVSCDITNGCSYMYNGNKYGTAYSGTSGTGVHKPWGEKQNAYMDEVLSEIFGVVMVYKGVTTETFRGTPDLRGGSYYDKKSNPNCGNNCMGQQDALQDSRNGMSYEEILAKYYNGDKFDLINIKEGLYVEDKYYSNASFDGNIIFFDQGDYKEAFCSRTSGNRAASIAEAGCGVTAAAIVAASLKGDKTLDPIYFSNLAKQTGDCGYDVDGTSPSFFQKVAAKFNFQYQRIGKKEADKVLTALANQNTLVIAHMGKGHFTNGGHYIVLAKVNTNRQVYVYDPNNKYGKGGNGWYNFDDIAGELRGDFHIFTR